MGQYRRHFAILLGATVVICSAIIGARWSKLAGRVELTELDLPVTSYTQEEQKTRADLPAQSAADGQGEPTPAGLLDLNTASVAELEELPGIGPVLARNIVDYRSKHGPFSSIEQLDQVTGIGDKKLAGLRDLVGVDVTAQR